MTTPAAWTDAWRASPSKLAGVVEEPPGAVAGAIRLGDLRDLLDRLLDPDRLRRAGGVGDQLGDAVGLGERQLEHAAHVADGRLRLHRPEGDDLRDRLVAVLLLHVLDDLAPAVVAEVDVDVGHRDPLGVEEALEDQAVAQRVEVGDAEGVGHEAARRRPAPGPDGDPALARVADEIGHDQEVARVAGLADHVELVVEPLAGLLGDRVVAPREALARLCLEQILERVVLRRQRERRQVRRVEVELDLAPLGDPGRVRQRLGVIREGAPPSPRDS